MEILNQSIIVHKPNYFHLAYLAATTKTTKLVPGGLSAVGLSVLISGCIFSLISLKINKLLIAKGLMKNNFFFKKANLIFLSLGLILILAAIFIVPRKVMLYDEIRYESPGMITSLNIDFISNQISRHLKDNEPIPENMSAISEQWKIGKKQIQDGWFHEMQLTKSIDNGKMTYLVTSAGKDGKFGTADDVTSDPITYPEKEIDVVEASI